MCHTGHTIIWVFKWCLLPRKKYEVENEYNVKFNPIGKHDTKPEEYSNINIESGYYDSDGNLITGSLEKPPSYRKNKSYPLYTLQEMDQYNEASCRIPTIDNPFMNPNVTDYGTGDHPVACNTSDDKIKNTIVDKFNSNLYRNIEDIWEIQNSQRQFYTIPSTSIPNQQKEFAEWLYKSPITCKEDNQCLRYEDLRYKR